MRQTLGGAMISARSPKRKKAAGKVKLSRACMRAKKRPLSSGRTRSWKRVTNLTLLTPRQQPAQKSAAEEEPLVHEESGQEERDAEQQHAGGAQAQDSGRGASGGDPLGAEGAGEDAEPDRGLQESEQGRRAAQGDLHVEGQDHEDRGQEKIDAAEAEEHLLEPRGVLEGGPDGAASSSRLAPRAARGGCRVQQVLAPAENRKLRALRTMTPRMPMRSMSRAPAMAPVKLAKDWVEDWKATAASRSSGGAASATALLSAGSKKAWARARKKPAMQAPAKLRRPAWNRDGRRRK